MSLRAGFYPDYSNGLHTFISLLNILKLKTSMTLKTYALSRLTVLLLLPVLSSRASAQASFSISPSVASAQVAPNGDTVARAVITNLTNQTLALTWTREILNLQPATALTAVLDPYLSHLPSRNSFNFTLMPADSGEMSLVYFNYSNDPGCALVRIRVVNQNNPADSTSALYLINDCATTALDPQAARPAARLYPNPFTETFRLDAGEEITRLRFLHADGREALLLEVSPDQAYTPERLPAGHYTLVLEGRDGRAIQSFQVRKL